MKQLHIQPSDIPKKGTDSIVFFYLYRINGFSSLLFVFFMSCAIAGAQTSDPELKRVSDVRIEIEQVGGINSDNLVRLASDLIGLHKGDLLTDDKLNAGIQAITKTGVFESIDADSNTSADNGKDEVQIILKLKPARIIKDIKIKGVIYPFFEKDILNAMSIYPGEAFKPRKFERQPELIARMLEKEGFIKPLVTLERETDPEDGKMVISVSIVKDDFWYIGDVKFKGNEAFTDLRLGAALETSRSSFLPDVLSRYSDSRMKDEVKLLTDFYRLKGYADVSISTEAKRDEETRTVDAIIKIIEGPLYNVAFRGNDFFWDLTLKKEVALEKDGNRHNLGVRKSIRNIKKKYLDEGFENVSVSTEEKLSEDGKKKNLVFVINEGHRTLVSNVEITGNSSIEAGEVQKSMLTRKSGIFFKEPYSKDMVDGDVESVNSFYKSRGFMDAETDAEVSFDESRESADVKMLVREKTRYFTKSIRFKGLDIISENDALGAINSAEGKPFSQSDIEGDEKKISALISEKGYPHVSVKAESAHDKNTGAVDLLFTVDKGPFVRVGNAYFHGNVRTRDSLLKKELNLHQGEPFSLTKVLEAQKSIRNMDIFNSVQFTSIGLAEKKDTVHILAEIEEKKPYYFQAGVGYDSQKGMYSSAKTGDRNFLGKNKELWASGEASQTTYKAETGIADPRFTGFKLSAKTRIYADQSEEFNKDYGTRSFGSLTEFEKKWSPSLYTSNSVRLEQREQYRVGAIKDDSTLQPEAEEQRRLVALTPAVRYDLRDSFIRPRKGMEAVFSVDLSRSLENNYDDFRKYKLDLSFYHSPFDMLTLAAAGRFAYIDAESDLTSDQLLYLGGTTTVRGYNENLLSIDENGDALGGRSSVSGSLEARLELGMKIELILFTDTGSVGHYMDNNGDDSFKSTIGAGIGYITPIGPFSVMYGHKLNRKDGEDAGNVHFSVGYVF